VRQVVVGSKDFVEQEILAELMAQEIEARGVEVKRRFHFGGTDITHIALTSGEIDLYVEYTGTALVAILGKEPVFDPDSVYRDVQREYLRRWSLVVGRPLGFENTFALVVRQADADSLDLETIGDLAEVAPGWTAGFGPEFMERPDGYPGLKDRYGFEFGRVRQMDLGLLYRAIAGGQIDVAVGNSTDGQIPALGLAVPRDNLRYFPPYQAVPVVRQETIEMQPAVRKVLEELEGTLTAERMRVLNGQVVMDGEDIRTVVQEWRAEGT
jgi:glycine betaine/choline ABC-type transport system substrate-binding protein